MKTETINVSGMTCGGCTAKVTQALASLPGVVKADVSLSKKSADVTFDERLVSVGRMGAALRSAGYDLSAKQGATSSGGCCGS